MIWEAWNGLEVVCNIVTAKINNSAIVSPVAPLMMMFLFSIAVNLRERTAYFDSFVRKCLTGCVTRGWVGGGNAALPEPTSSHEEAENAATPTRRVHAVLGCLALRGLCLTMQPLVCLVLIARGLDQSETAIGGLPG